MTHKLERYEGGQVTAISAKLEQITLELSFFSEVCKAEQEKIIDKPSNIG